MPRLPSPLALAILLAASCASPRAKEDPAPTPDELRAHVLWLADDAREGRGAGTQAERIAAAYVAGQFARAGLLPAGDEGSWFQEFEIALPPQPGACALTVDGAPVAGAAPLALSANGRCDAPLSLEPRDAIALVRCTSPDAAALRNSLRAAAEAGALAAVVGVHADDVAAVGLEALPFDFAGGTVALRAAAIPSADFTALWTRLQSGARPSADLEVAVLRPTARSRNVLGLLPGSGPDVLVVGAHYDHLGFGGEGSLAGGARAIHNGADDNASGTAVLIEMAEAWSARAEPGEVGLLFAAWGAEEMGLLGSAHWVKDPTVALDRVRANLNLDMIGRAANGAITVGSAETAAAFRPALDAAQAGLAAAGRDLRLAIAEGPLPGGGGSDHMSFHQAGIAALFFFSGLHADYHKPSDDADKLDYARMSEVAEAAALVLEQLQAADRAALAYVKPAAPTAGPREGRRPGIWFGSIPDYAAAPEGGGMQIAGTSPGSPAEKAGLLAGDVIRALDGTPIADIYAIKDALGGYRDGQTIQVTVLRGGETLQLPLTFFPRP